MESRIFHSKQTETNYISCSSSVTSAILLIDRGSTTKTNLSKLAVLQKRAVRALERTPFNDTTSPYKIKYKLVPPSLLYTEKLSLYMFMQIKENWTNFESSYLQTTTDRNLRVINYKLPKTRTNYGTQCLRYKIPRLLNSNKELLDIIKESSSLTVYKRKICKYR